MNSSKKIEINRSTLVSLKAELCRKQEEVSQAKAQAQFIKGHQGPNKKPNIWDKKNPGVDSRHERDHEEIQAENAAINKAKSILEAKAELYDKLSSAGASREETIQAQSVALVDFRQKQREDAHKQEVKRQEEKEEEEEKYDSDDYEKPSDSEDEWVDYTDCLGRTRRCLRRDLKIVKGQDSKLAGSLYKIDTEPLVPAESEKILAKEESESRVPTPPLEQRLVSGDLQREALRAKWQLEETNLLKKDDVHYQDILYDEVRSHGVSYYGFSRDEKERRVQQEQLAKVRAETKKGQASAQDARLRREQQLRARLRAAANRKRQRQGLPPLPDSDGERAPGDSDEEAEVERLLLGSRAPQPTAPPEPEPLTREQQPKPVEPRLWDLDKEKPVLTQEEWNEQQRAVRDSEFAPPSSLYGFNSGGTFQLKQKSGKVVMKVEKGKNLEPLSIPRKSATKRPQFHLSSSEDEFIGPLPRPQVKTPPSKKKGRKFKKISKNKNTIGPLPPQSTGTNLNILADIQLPDMHVPPPNYSIPPPAVFLTHAAPSGSVPTPVPAPPKIPKTKRVWSDNPPEEQSSRGKGTEIAPPTSMDYHIGGAHKKFIKPGTSIAPKKEVESSIAAGLAFLRKQAETKDKQPTKGCFDVI